MTSEGLGRINFNINQMLNKNVANKIVQQTKLFEKSQTEPTHELSISDNNITPITIIRAADHHLK